MTSRLGGVLLAAAMLLCGIATAATPPGEPVVNQAYVSYGVAPGQPTVVPSNEVTLITAVIRSPSILEFIRLTPSSPRVEPIGPSLCLQGGNAVSAPVPAAGAAPGTTEASAYNIGETVYLRLEDSDQNADYQVAEFADVSLRQTASGDQETLRLTETGPDTGIFTGFLGSSPDAALRGDCLLQASPGSEATATYRDPLDTTDFSETAAIFDPTGVVFDSSTGSPVDGVRIELVEAGTGRPATVLGNDGVSGFPSAIVTGQTVTDASGVRYDFSDGRFRFPNVAAGSYRLVVEAPDGYASPSDASPGDLQQLAGSPYALTAASFGGELTHDGSGPLLVDYPIDPQDVSLFVQKRANISVAAPGDFIAYEVVVSNASTSDTASGVLAIDRLPGGTRYVRGSTTRDGVSTGDPEVRNGGELHFRLGDLAADTQATISYVLEIVAGRDGEQLENTVAARADGGAVSNQAVASVMLREDLFRSKSTLLGRVVEGNCALESFAEDRGVAGVRVYLEDGRYAVTDEGGRFHFEGLSPGTHVAQLDTTTVPDYFDVLGCSESARFAGRGDSQLIELSAGALQRTNFYLARQIAPEGNVNLTFRTAGTGTRDRVAYDVDLSGTGEVEVEGLQVSILLPDGVSYGTGSLSVGGNAVPDPRIAGQSLTIDLDSRAGDWRLPIRFTADIDAAATGELVTRALARFNGPDGERQQTPVAETIIRREAATWENTGYVLALRFGVLSAELAGDDRAQLNELINGWTGVRDIRITAVGHSDNTRISARSRHVYADNYALSRARAESAARYLAQALGVADEDIQVEGRGPDEPVATNENSEGRKQNRRVELVLAGSRPGRQSFVEVAKETSGTLVTETRGATPGANANARQLLDAEALAEHLAPPKQSETTLDGLSPGTGWVLPEEGFRPAIPAMRVSIRHAVDQSVSLFVNGLEVDPINFAGKESDTERNVAVSRWAGVPLLEGSNQLTADIIGPDGLVADRLTQRVHLAGTAVRAEFLPEVSHLVADGKTRPVVAVRLYDRFGEPARHSSVGEFSVDAPYRSWWSVQNDRENRLVQLSERRPLYTVGDEGVAFIELEPTTASGQATINLRLSNQREQEVIAWLQPAARDWILVGFGEGTLGYSQLSRNAQPADPDARDGYYDDGRLAFFAKGSIKGEYLLTLAYDSARSSAESRQRFQSEIDPDAYYSLYADNTEQRFEAASQRKLYVKLERKQFNALFGDFSSGLSATELARYERRMNGFRSEYSGQRVAYTVFASENDQSLVRDEIQGDGTSGLYRLSVSPIIAQSESIQIEVRDRFDQAEVLSTRALSRFLDYNLDPLDGTLYFKQPVPSRDAAFNPVFIVAEYETRADVGDDLTAGGRVALRSDDGRLEAGVTHINEGQPAASSRLSGVDLRWQASAGTLVRAELATSSARDAAGSASGEAAMVTIEHRSEKLDLRAEYREADQDFGLGQRPVAEQGIRKFGVDGRYEFRGELALRAQASFQENLETGGERVLAEADLEYQSERTTATVGLTHADDRFADGESRSSDIMDAGVSRRLFDSALSVRANGSLDLGSQAENADFPSSYVFGVDYEIKPEVNLFLEYENASGRDIDAEMTRVGVRASPWSRAQLDTSVSSEMSEFGPRLYSNLGLVQGFQLSEQWLIDVGVDQTRTFREPSLRNFDEDRELASGSYRDDFTAGYVGALFQSESWSVNSRLEYRHADLEQRMTFLTGWYREASRGHGLSAGMTIFQSDRDDGADALRAELRLGWALRPAESPWALLYRADLINEQRALINGDESTWRVVSNLNANRRFGAASQLGLQYASKFVRSQFDTVTVDGYTDLTGVDARLGFRDRWEFAIHGSAYNSYRANTVDYGTGLSLGFNLADDMWLSVGYNVEGFHDEDFAAARYTAAGPYLRITMRAHQDQLKRITGR